MTEFYQVIENPFGPGWAVVNELDIVVRTNPRREIMERYANDRQFRLWLAYDCIRAERLWRGNQPTTQAQSSAR